MISVRTAVGRAGALVCAVTVAGAIALATAPGASADVDVAIPSPSTMAAGSSPDFHLEMQTSATLDGSIGFWSNDTLGWQLTETGGYSGTLVGDTLTCASGVTFQSSGFLDGTPGVYPGACTLTWGGGPGDYVDIYMDLPDLGFSLTGNYTINVHVPAGILVAPTTPGTYTLEAYAYNGTDNRALFDVVVSGSDSAVAPPRHLQQVGLPASGSCEAIPDADLAWGTGLTGGWSKSWGEWMNKGTGGWTCSRTLLWSNAMGHWVLAP